MEVNINFSSMRDPENTGEYNHPVEYHAYKLAEALLREHGMLDGKMQAGRVVLRGNLTTPEHDNDPTDRVTKTSVEIEFVVDAILLKDVK